MWHYLAVPTACLHFFHFQFSCHFRGKMFVPLTVFQIDFFWCGLDQLCTIFHFLPFLCSSQMSQLNLVLNPCNFRTFTKAAFLSLTFSTPFRFFSEVIVARSRCSAIKCISFGSVTCRICSYLSRESNYAEFLLLYWGTVVLWLHWSCLELKEVH